ncbi:MAG: hypothetical protein M3Z14_05005 [Candidatus Eremiobacteraeota bacterium]|nr:hypothetical protein [Candidatus Eremiobacteraeota bacterium]
MAQIKSEKRGQSGGKPSRSRVILLPRGPDGNRRRTRLTTHGTQKEFEQAYMQRMNEIHEGRYTPVDRMTVAQYLSEWLEGAKGNLSGKTWERFEQIARVHVIPTLGDIPLPRLTAGRLNKASVSGARAG